MAQHILADNTDETCPPQPRPIFLTSAKAISETLQRLLDTSRKSIDLIVADNYIETATFESVLVPMAHRRNIIASEGHILSFYIDVSPHESLRQASREAKAAIDRLETEIGMRQDLYELVEAVAQRRPELDTESQRLPDFEQRNFFKNGLSIADTCLRERYKEIKQRLSELQMEFRRNLADENGYVAFSAEELDGMSKDFLDGLEPDHDSTGEAGKHRVSFKMMHQQNLLRYAKRGETRERYFMAYENRCRANIPLFREVILLRGEAARLLGLASHAELRTRELMAKTPENVHAFLEDLDLQLRPSAHAELDALRALKTRHLQAQGNEPDGRLCVWDFAYYHRLMLETEHAVGQDKVAEYFPIQSVVPAMLELFEQIFGLSFRQS